MLHQPLKTHFARPISTLLSLAAFVLSAGLNAGCGGASVGGDVRLPESQRYDIDPSIASSGALDIPGSAEFNYASTRSGQSGRGRGDARRIGEGGAAARAECEPDGSAWGEFQIGYSFDNKTDRPLDATVKLRLKVSESSEIRQDAGDGEAAPLVAHGDSTRRAEGAPPRSRDAPGAPAESTTATTNLRFFIKDTYGMETKSQNLLASSLALGPRFHGKEQELIFDARFEPGRGYYLIVAGRAEVASEQGKSVAVSVEVTDMSLEITWKPTGATALGNDESNAPEITANRKP